MIDLTTELSLEEAFQILEINSDTEFNEIKKKYRELARKWHPDKNPDNIEVAGEKTKLIIKAYSFVINNFKEKKQNKKFNLEDLVFTEEDKEIINSEEFKNFENANYDNYLYNKDYSYWLKEFKEGFLFSKIDIDLDGPNQKIIAFKYGALKKDGTRLYDYFTPYEQIVYELNQKILEECKELNLSDELTNKCVQYKIQPKERIEVITENYKEYGKYLFFYWKNIIISSKDNLVKLHFFKLIKQCFTFKDLNLNMFSASQPNLISRSRQFTAIDNSNDTEHKDKNFKKKQTGNFKNLQKQSFSQKVDNTKTNNNIKPDNYWQKIPNNNNTKSENNIVINSVITSVIVVSIVLFFFLLIKILKIKKVKN